MPSDQTTLLSHDITLDHVNHSFLFDQTIIRAFSPVLRRLGRTRVRKARQSCSRHRWRPPDKAVRKLPNNGSAAPPAKYSRALGVGPVAVSDLQDQSA